MKQCSFDGCAKKHVARGLCSGHYDQWRTGKPLSPLKRKAACSSIQDRIKEDISSYAKYVDRGYPTPCLEMRKHARSSHGYGVIGFQGKLYLRHREAYFLQHPEVSREFRICHHCDNRRCFRVSHLFHGTAQDNSTDAVRKGRIPKGERHGRAKFSDATISDMLSLYRTGQFTQQAIADQFGMSQQFVSLIVRGKKRI